MSGTPEHEKEAVPAGAPDPGAEYSRRPPRPSGSRVRGPWLVLGVCLAAAAALYPFDAEVAAAAARLEASLGGDMRRELRVLQQWGAPASVAIGAAALWLLDPPRRRRLLDWLFTLVLVSLAALALKMFLGRPRPWIGDAERIPGPLGATPVEGVGVVRAWEVWRGAGSELWSMPSSHTAAAAVMSVFLGINYPALRPLCWLMLGLVGGCRVLFADHWPSDVAAGAGLGVALAWASVRGYWGVRALDWLWLRLIDREARPAYPALRASLEGIGGRG